MTHAISGIIPIAHLASYGLVGAFVLALPLGTFSLAVLTGSSLWVAGFTSMGYGLHVLGWDPLIATLCAVAGLITIEGGLAWILAKRSAARASTSADGPAQS
jgi:membrane protein DedA with SNARE-associated domain